ncbi:MAG: hypothetical protein ACM359_03645 [Bacillota bacterium]
MSNQSEERWVTIATFAGSPEAHLAAAKLDAEGIPAVLLDEHVAALGWGAVGAGAEVKLQVPASAAARGAEILKSRSDLANSAESTEQLPVACPRCKSQQVQAARPSLGRGIISVLLCVPLLFPGRRFRCGACGHTWRE